MDFDLSKENIQPLRGGRNASQLEMALQAQTNQEFQKQLQLQKEQYETSIRNYTGEDPLDNWYNYIYWNVQTHPKQGVDGNLILLLEQCLARFENDKRYTHDRRYCKLWIKYIDLQQNPLELYQMMYTRGIGRGCTDLYKAWAYYYEAAGDFQSANKVYERGIKELAQPHDELLAAHHNLIMAAGQHMVYGRNEQALQEKRHALTSLQTYKSGHVGHLRTPLPGDPVVTVGATSSRNSNVPMQIYEDAEDLNSIIIPPTSIIKAAKREEVTKENTIKPGTWIKPYMKKSVASAGGCSSFTVHEDCGDVRPKFPPQTLETYTDWIVSLTLPEPKDDRMIPMYPKHKVYGHGFKEYSLEELRAQRYILNKPKTELMCTTTTTTTNSPLVIFEDDPQPMQLQEQSMQHHQQHSLIQPPPPNITSNSFNNNITNNNCTNSRESNYNKRFTLCKQSPNQSGSNLLAPAHFVHRSSNENIGLDVWNSPNTSTRATPTNTPYVIYEQDSLRTQPEPKGSAMKTPLKDLNAEELAETGSRGGMDMAAAAPVDAAKNLPVFDIDEDDEDDVIFNGSSPSQINNISCNTQTFNFNLNAMKVSTPQNKQDHAHFENRADSKNWCKQLFSENTTRIDDRADKQLSTIKEETTSNYGSSSSSSCGTKSSILNNYAKQKNMSDISEEHHSYLAQNSMANAALRASLLGNLVDLNTPANLSINVQPEPPVITDRKIPSPVIVSPINYIPSDPFKPSLIKKLLEKVRFPGPHTRGYFTVGNISRLVVKKESISLGPDRYVIEKQLGKGTFGTVFKGVDLKTSSTVALKYQKPANEWEFYICRELRSRLADHYLRDRFMDIRVGYFSEQASILVSEFMPCGSLLDVANTIRQKTGRVMKESLCIYFCIEMLKVVQAMHSVKIIHADIKPDNFLVELLPDSTVALQLIDFGCSIDMSLFPPDTSFTRRITTENFVSCEMLEGRPWNYHTDMFCIAATAHVLLFDKYLQLRNNGRLWGIKEHIPRYLRSDLWNKFFSTLLNQQQGPADSDALQTLLDDSLKRKSDDYHTDMRLLLNILRNR